MPQNTMHTPELHQKKGLSHTGRLLLILGILTFILLALTAVLYNHLDEPLYILWNMVLGIIPLFFALWIVRRDRLHRAKLPTVLLFFAWLFFFPNAPYLITDFIHMNLYTYVDAAGHYTTALMPWLGLSQLLLGIFIGCVCGLLSLYLLHRLVARRFCGVLGWLFAAAVWVLSGVGIYIGRFMRFNSWNVLTHPADILLDFQEALGPRTLALCFIFTMFTAAAYLLFYVCFEAAYAAGQKGAAARTE